MNKDELLNSDFLKQFKDSKDFGNFMDDLYKRGVETMLEGELEAHLDIQKMNSGQISQMPEMDLAERN